MSTTAHSHPTAPHEGQRPSSVTESQIPVKPKLRGWLHLGMVPVTLVAGIWLIIAAAPQYTVACVVFILTALMLFGCSALYHRGNWGPRGEGILRRLDHSNIALIIAGTYTPIAVALLPTGQSRLLLWVIWIGALAAILVRVLWLAAPRWSYVPIYLALGWVAVWFLPTMWQRGGPAIVLLILAGGIAYSLGAIVYGLKRPNPSPRWFGFHEIFHTCTLIGFTCHLIAVALAVVP